MATLLDSSVRIFASDLQEFVSLTFRIVNYFVEAVEKSFYYILLSFHALHIPHMSGSAVSSAPRVETPLILQTQILKRLGIANKRLGLSEKRK